VRAAAADLLMLPSDLKPGDLLGKYEILALIAQGGMASVWAARIAGSHGRVVAVKTMLPALSEDADFEAMFLDEARLASRIRHPHVAEIVDLGEDEGWLYLVMEWVDGETVGTLNKRSKSRGGYPPGVLARIVADACAGLHAAHELADEQGHALDVVHRDITPQNVMVTAEGVVKLVDFGVAKAKGRLYQTQVKGLLKGKVPYLSPEQITAEKVDRRADVFALGVVVYVMVSGRHPFRGDDDKATMDNIATRTPVSLSALVPGVPAEIDAIVAKALEKDPAARWPTAKAMRDAFEAFLAGRGEVVTQADLAKYVADVAGEASAERRKRLADAVAAADARESRTRPAPRGRAMRAAPLLSGVLPVALEDAAPPDRSAEPAAPEVAPAPVVPTTTTWGGSGNATWPIVVAAVLAVVGGVLLVVLYLALHADAEPPAPAGARPLPSATP
jgi:serine/threonine-protein kinase